MDVIFYFKNLISDIVDKEYSSKIDKTNIVVEMSKNQENGDLSTNASMVLASQLKKSPINIAEEIIKEIKKIKEVIKAEIAGPGFINMWISNEYWQEKLKEILKSGINYGNNNIGNGEKINLEFVSANPTGPLHIGHIRNGIYGDVVANMLKKCGYNVTKEFYINDIGNQVQKMVQTVYLRYKESLGIEIGEIPEGLYPGEYMIDVAKKIIELDGDKWLASQEIEWQPRFKELSIHFMIEMIKEDLHDMGIIHDIFISESSLHKNSKLLDTAIEKLKKHDLIYIGKLDKPLSNKAVNWESKSQLLVRATAFGDDCDRAIYKSNGEWSYFASDLAYIIHKYERGFDKAIYVLGSEQILVVKRLEKLSKYLTDDKMKVQGLIYEMVGIIKDDKPLKLSKRSGNLITVKDCLKELNKDIIRFMMLTRKSDMPVKLNINKLKLQNKDNPVFYVQYAYARSCSLFKIAKAQFKDLDFSDFAIESADISLLNLSEEINLIKYMSQWPNVIKSATKNMDPQRLTLFITGLASIFHGIWTKGKSDPKYRFIIENNYELTLAKLGLIKGMINVIESCCDIISIDLKDSM